MTQVPTDHDTAPSLEPASDPAQAPTLDTATLTIDLFARLTDAHRELFRARMARAWRQADEHLLRLRATALLIACLPAHPDSDAYRLKVLAAVTLREEDGAEASHAWLMIERALELDQRCAPVA